MKTKYTLAIGLSALVLFSFSAASEAEVRGLAMYGWTTNYTDRQEMCFWITLSDTELRHPPDAITSMTITAPDQSVFDLTVDDIWNPYSEGFWAAYEAGDFDSEVIPSGRYILKVVDTSGKTTRAWDHVKAAFLEPPVINFPTEGSTVGTTPRIRWTKVPGATHYRIHLFEEWGGPIYDYSYHQMKVNRLYFKIPRGVLKSGCAYDLQIEARDSYQDLDKRSRSDWVTFSIR